jgi:hypothetical protein
MRVMVKRGMAWEVTHDKEEASLRVMHQGREVDWDRTTGRIELMGLNNEVYTGWIQHQGRMESVVCPV